MHNGPKVCLSLTSGRSNENPDESSAELGSKDQLPSDDSVSSILKKNLKKIESYLPKREIND